MGVCIPSLGYASSISEDLRLSVEEAMAIGIAGDNSCRVSQNTLKMQWNKSCVVSSRVVLARQRGERRW